MKRGTTPTFTVTCDEDLSDYKIDLTLKQGATELTITPECEATADGCVLSVTLTQEQTLMFSDRLKANMQIRAVNSAGNAIASNIMYVDVGKILKDGVITYE